MPAQYRQNPLPGNPGESLAAAGQGVVAVTKAAAGVLSGVTRTAADAVAEVNPVSGLTDVAAKAGAWMSDRNNWFRVAKVSLGAVLIVVGLAKLAAPATGAVVGAVAPVGKVAKAAGKLSS